MTAKIRIASVFLFLGLAGCDSLQTRPSDTAVSHITSNLRYFLDSRTGQCFAAVGQATSGAQALVQITW